MSMLNPGRTYFEPHERNMEYSAVFRVFQKKPMLPQPVCVSEVHVVGAERVHNYRKSIERDLHMDRFAFIRVLHSDSVVPEVLYPVQYDVPK